MKNADKKNSEKKQPVDITEIRIDHSLPVEKRRKQYIRKVGDPYHVMVGDIEVDIGFANNGTSMETAFGHMLMMN